MANYTKFALPILFWLLLACASYFIFNGVTGQNKSDTTIGIAILVLISLNSGYLKAKVQFKLNLVFLLVAFAANENTIIFGHSFEIDNNTRIVLTSMGILGIMYSFVYLFYEMSTEPEINAKKDKNVKNNTSNNTANTKTNVKQKTK